MRDIRATVAGAVLMSCVSCGPCLGQAVQQYSRNDLGALPLPDPIWVYNNWSAYDELSDSIPLTEELALRELQEIARLRGVGVRFDYYMMDAFWFAPDGGYREWRKPNWPNGPDRWIAECRRQGVCRVVVRLQFAREDRRGPGMAGLAQQARRAMSFSEGGFFPIS